MSWPICLFARTGGERRRTALVGEPAGNALGSVPSGRPVPTGDEESTRFTPDFQIETTEDSFVFKADLLGIKDNEVDIAVSGDRLTISGHLYDPRACSYAGFTRAFTLPETHDGDETDSRRPR